MRRERDRGGKDVLGTRILRKRSYDRARLSKALVPTACVCTYDV